MTCPSERRPPWLSEATFRTCLLKNFTETVSCPGCNEKFGGVLKNGKLRHELRYIVHCVEECPQYKDLKLITECKPCGLKFLDNKSLLNHRETGSHKYRYYNRDWIPLNLITMSYRPSSYDTSVSCPGCLSVFPARTFKNSDATIKPRIDYYVHCVEECVRIRELGVLWPKCKLCPLIFLDQQSAVDHMKMVHKKASLTQVSLTSDSTSTTESGDESDVDVVGLTDSENNLNNNTNSSSNSEPLAPDFLTDFDLDDDIPELSFEANFPEAFAK